MLISGRFHAAYKSSLQTGSIKDDVLCVSRTTRVYIIHALVRPGTACGTIYDIIYEIAQLYHLCGAHSGSPQLSSSYVRRTVYLLLF